MEAKTTNEVSFSVSALLDERFGKKGTDVIISIGLKILIIKPSELSVLSASKKLHNDMLI